MLLSDIISAVLFLPFLFFLFYVAERIMDKIVQKKKKEAELKEIRKRKRELYFEMKKCA